MYQYLRLDVNCQWMDVATLITNHIATSEKVAWRSVFGNLLYTVTCRAFRGINNVQGLCTYIRTDRKQNTFFFIVLLSTQLLVHISYVAN